MRYINLTIMFKDGSEIVYHDCEQRLLAKDDILMITYNNMRIKYHWSEIKSIIGETIIA